MPLSFLPSSLPVKNIKFPISFFFITTLHLVPPYVTKEFVKHAPTLYYYARLKVKLNLLPVVTTATEEVESSDSPKLGSSCS